MKNDNIKIFITGGTIDNLEYSDEKDAPKNHQSIIPALLKQARLAVGTDYEILMQKDSKFVNDADRKEILRKCQEAKEEKIVITHGTMTMPETAKFLLAANISKTVLLFGAAIPANRENSDALFNLGTAIAAVQILPKGVYISMNGKIFSADNVKKNLGTGIFEELP